MATLIVILGFYIWMMALGRGSIAFADENTFESSSINVVIPKSTVIAGDETNLFCWVFYTNLPKASPTESPKTDWKCRWKFFARNVSLNSNNFQVIEKKLDESDFKRTYVHCNLTINNTEFAIHDGRYQCEFYLANERLALKSATTLDVFVVEPPTISVNSTNITITTNKFHYIKVSLLCVATGRPRPTLTWSTLSANGSSTTISFSNRFSLCEECHAGNKLPTAVYTATSKLDIHGRNFIDGGNFNCTATNLHGQDSVQFVLNRTETEVSRTKTELDATGIFQDRIETAQSSHMGTMSSTGAVQVFISSKKGLSTMFGLICFILVI